jgi:hypothetical protein
LAIELTAPEQQTVTRIEATIQTAADHFVAGEFQAAADSISQAMKWIAAASKQATPDLLVALQPSIKRIKRAHTLLEFEGIALPPLHPTQPAQSPQARQTAPLPQGKRSSPAAPIPQPNAELTMSSTAKLQREPDRAVTVRPPKQPDLQDREPKVPAAGVEATAVALAKPVASARSSVQETDLPAPPPPAQLLPPPPQPELPQPELPQPELPQPEQPAQTMPAAISFTNTIAPILVNRCGRCHISDMAGQVSMASFADLMRGPSAGPIVTAGDPQTSRLVEVIESGDMPRGDGQVMPAELDKLKAWIAAGAKFDGGQPTADLVGLSQQDWISTATPDQIRVRRRVEADRKLTLVSGVGQKFNSIETNNFLVIGVVSSETIELISQLAESQLKTISAIVPLEAGPFFPGRATIIVLPRHYEYSEFVRMVEHRQVPFDWASHWRFDGVDAYVALAAGDETDEQLIAQRLAAPIAALAVKVRGNGIPDWLANGLGIALQRPADQRDYPWQTDQLQLRIAISAMRDASDFSEGRLTPEQTDRIGTEIAASMLVGKRRRLLDRAMRRVVEGESFETAFTDAYGGPLADYIAAWWKATSASTPVR